MRQKKQSKYFCSEFGEEHHFTGIQFNLLITKRNVEENLLELCSFTSTGLCNSQPHIISKLAEEFSGLFLAGITLASISKALQRIQKILRML